MTSRAPSLYGFAPLLGLMVLGRDGVVRAWEFERSPRPRLAYETPSPSPSPERLRPTRLYVVGGSYRVEGDELRETRGPSGLKRLEVASVRDLPEHRRQVARFRAGHEGKVPAYAVEGTVYPFSGPRTFHGHLVAVLYTDDKGAGDGRAAFIHGARDLSDADVIPEHARPEVWTTREGRSIHLRGGALAVCRGWLYDAPRGARRAA